MALRVYLAGKIGRHDWRSSIVPSIGTVDGTAKPPAIPALIGGVVGGHDYVGPWFSDLGGHGVAHGPNTHGRGIGGFLSSALDPYLDSATPGNVAMQCCVQIERADVVFAWIDGVTAYGTLVEIGYARAIGKEVWVGGYPIEDLWFAFSVATEVEFVRQPTDNALVIWGRMLEKYGAQLESDKNYVAGLVNRKTQAETDVARFVEYAKAARPNQLRGDVWAKTNGACWYCGCCLNPFQNFHIEHVNPKSRGGSDTLDNLAPSCRACNLSKGGMTVEQFRRKRGGGKFHFELAADGAA